MIPRLQIFEGESGIKSLFRDMLFELREQNIMQIRMLSANTFEEWTGDETLTKIVREFFEDVRREHIDIELFEVTGSLVPERIRKQDITDLDPSSIPVARGTTNIFIVGHSVYIASYKSSHIGLKIKQAELSQIFHFLFDVLGKAQ